MSLRLPRLVIILTILLVSSTLYFLYPSSRTPRSPGDPYDGYEAGGIDSPHYRDPIVPKYNAHEEERARLAASADYCDDEECEPPGQSPIKAPPLSGKERLAKGIQDGLGIANWLRGGGNKQDVTKATTGQSADVGELKGIHEDVLHGSVIMPKLENATAKAELGRAAWRVLHLMTLRYPENPNPTEREALKSYFHLFARMYPCGECAEEFQKLLKEYPPQVNLRLGKPEFDCLTLDETYDCGCGDEKAGEASTDEKEKTFPPPQKGEIGGKLLGGKKGSGKEQGKEWKDPTTPSEQVSTVEEAPSPEMAEAPKQEEPEEPKEKEKEIVVDEAARQAEMIELAHEELDSDLGDDF